MRNLPSMRDCAKLLKKCVDKNSDRYRWAADMTPEEIKADREHVIVGAIHCIRRNVPGPDQDIMNKPSKKGRKKMYQKGKKRAEQYVRLHKEGLLLGVDIAGDERKPEHGLRHFTAFFRYCNAQEPPLPFTTHAGESAAQDHGGDVTLALDNLRVAIESGARRVGHAARLLDWGKNAIKVFKLFLEKNILIELNARSNMLTNVDNPQRHKVLQTFRGRHPLFLNPFMRENGEALYQRFRQRVLPTTDDPSVNRTSIFGLAEELAFDCAHADNLGYQKAEAMLEELCTIGLNAMLRV